MLGEKFGHFCLNRLRQQGTRSIAQHLGERVSKRPWLKQLDHGSIGHGVSLLCWRSGGSNTPTIRRLLPVRPSPTSAYSSHSTRRDHIANEGTLRTAWIADACSIKEIGRRPKARPSLNREASRLGDVGSEDPFPGRKSRKLIRGTSTPETCRDAVSRRSLYRGLRASSPPGIGSGSSAKSAMLSKCRSVSATTRRSLSSTWFRRPCAAGNRGKR